MTVAQRGSTLTTVGDGVRPTSVLVVVVCYRAVDLTIDCLASLEGEMKQVPGAGVIVCENGTGDGAGEQVRAAVLSRGWEEWVEIREVSPNRGFSGGNNAILEDVLAWAQAPEFVLLLNADTIVRAGALRTLLEEAHRHPEVGVLSPRLEWPDGTPQISCFRDIHPLTDLDKAAGIGPMTRLLRPYVTAIPVSEAPSKPDWTSFACAMIPMPVLRKVGVLDPGFFLYFDDPDYCRRVRAAGYTILNVPTAHVVHLRGSSNPAKELAREKKRGPWYRFASRSRYYAKYYGRFGLLAANLSWTIGHCLAVARRLITRHPIPACEREARRHLDEFLAPDDPPPERGQDG